MDDFYFKTSNLTVGYNKKPLINDINIQLKKGEILTLIGPNGGGKSTILKSISKFLQTISGTVYIDNIDISNISYKELAKKLSVVLTERIRPEMMTCFEVVASGRYPYTNGFGLLTEKDKQIVKEAISQVHASDISEKGFLEISDGQRQRIMLARAIAQEPEIIVLDEPTSFLDIRYKIELLEILRKMAKENNIAIIMSLHEVDLASKISDIVLCVKGDHIDRVGTPGEIFTSEIIKDLYDIKNGSFNDIFGSVEFPKPTGDVKTFVLAGGGYGAKVYRALQKKNIPFYTGILYKNDIDYLLANDLSSEAIAIEAFNKITDDIYNNALNKLLSCDVVIDAGSPIGELNEFNLALKEKAKENNKKIINYLSGELNE